MKNLLSIFMSVVMVVTMLPRATFAADDPTSLQEITQEDASLNSGAGDPLNSEELAGVAVEESEKSPEHGFFKDQWDKVSSYVKEKAPQVWDKLKPYFEQGKTWAKDYYANVSEFAGKVGKLGVAATIGLSVLLCKIAYKVIGFVAKLIWPTDTQGSGQLATNNYSKTSTKSYSGSYTYCV